MPMLRGFITHLLTASSCFALVLTVIRLVFRTKNKTYHRQNQCKTGRSCKEVCNETPQHRHFCSRYYWTPLILVSGRDWRCYSGFNTQQARSLLLLYACQADGQEPAECRNRSLPAY